MSCIKSAKFTIELMYGNIKMLEILDSSRAFEDPNEAIKRAM